MAIVKAMYRRAVLLALAAAAALPAAAAAAPTRTAPCPDGAPAGTSCLQLEVPENRSVPGGRTISLFAARLRARTASPAPTPVLFLQGGPGEAATADLATLARSPLRARRDIILLDQRGTGLSRPALTCPEFDRAMPRFFTRVRRNARAELRHGRLAVRACAARLRSAGVALDAYNTRATADDVEDLRAALGVPAFDLYAVSYGTRAALEVLRRHPAGVRTAVLDSGSPPDEAEVRATRLAADVRAAFAHLAAACRCRLLHRLDRGLRRLDRQPVRAHARLAGSRRPVAVRVTGRDALAALFNALKDERLVPQLPRLVAALAAGDRRPVDQLVVPVLEAATAPGGTFLGAQLSVDCADNGGQITARDRALVRRPGRLGTLFLFSSNAFCEAWNVQPVDRSYATPVRSGVPTLLLAGAFDPISLPEQTRQAGSQLTHATYVELPQGSHVVSQSSACAARIAASFVAAGGRADQGCLRGRRAPRLRIG